MRGSGPSNRADTRLPYQKSQPKVAGVRKFKELIYESWRIAMLRRDQGVGTRRIAYSARVTEIGSQVSFYVPAADSEKLVVKLAKRGVDQRVNPGLKERSNYYTVNRVMNLWFRDDDIDQPLPETMDPTAMPE
jgi:hypothetical protein